MTNYNPSIDPADQDTLAGAIKFAFKKLLQNTDGMLPAKVIAYDRESNRVSVQLLITVVTTGGTQVERPQLSSIPVLVAGGGGYFLSFPLNAGDFGWVLANDRDISLFLQTYTNGPPNTARVKNFSDGVFIPDVMRNYTIESGHDNDLVISALDGSVYVALGTGTVTIKAASLVVEGDLSVSGTTDLQGNTTITGLGPYQLFVTGNIGATGAITPGV